jgi:hypothetical protein
MSTQVHPEHTSSPGHISSPRAHKFTPVYSVGWWCSIINFLCSVLWFVVCLFVLFPLVIVLSVLLPLVIVLSVLLPLVIVLSVFFLWSLCCLSFSFGHCVVCLFPLVIVLSVLLLLVIVLSVFFLLSLCCLQKSINHSYNLANILHTSVQVKNKNDKDHTTCKKRVSVERIIYVNKKSLMIPEG